MFMYFLEVPMKFIWKMGFLDKTLNDSIFKRLPIVLKFMTFDFQYPDAQHVVIKYSTNLQIEVQFTFYSFWFYSNAICRNAQNMWI